jgi:hypothetical protein
VSNWRWRHSKYRELLLWLSAVFIFIAIMAFCLVVAKYGR